MFKSLDFISKALYAHALSLQIFYPEQSIQSYNDTNMSLHK